MRGRAASCAHERRRRECVGGRRLGRRLGLSGGGRGGLGRLRLGRLGRLGGVGDAHQPDALDIVWPAVMCRERARGQSSGEVVEPAPLVDTPIGSLKPTLAVSTAAHPLALVHVAVRVTHAAAPVPPIVAKGARVQGAVGTVQRARTVLAVA